MKRCTIIVFVVIGSAILAGCFGEEEKTKAPKKDYIIVKNDGVENFKVTLQNRVKDKVLICLLYTSPSPRD